MNSKDFALFLQATLGTYRDCAAKATRGLIKNWLLLPGSVASYFIYRVCAEIFYPMGFGGRLIVGLISAVLIAIYYAWLSDTVKRDKLQLRSLYQIDYGLLFITINVGFILMVPTFLVANLIQGLQLEWILYCLLLGFVIVFNAIPEVIIVHRYDGMHALGQAATFTRENWIEWFFPFIIFLLPWICISPARVLFYLTGTDPLLPVTMLLAGARVASEQLHLPEYPAIALALVLANWFMIFRSHLFNEMESGTRRQRLYRAKQR